MDQIILSHLFLNTILLIEEKEIKTHKTLEI